MPPRADLRASTRRSRSDGTRAHLAALPATTGGSAVKDPFDPDLMTPEARAREVAEILATGYLRHRELRARGPAESAAAAAPETGRQPENDLDDMGDHEASCVPGRRS